MTDKLGCVKLTKLQSMLLVHENKFHCVEFRIQNGLPGTPLSLQESNCNRDFPLPQLVILIAVPLSVDHLSNVMK